ncbi:MAG: diaminopimelate decarboxylase [Cytophagales bacterium]|nr:diaminopimelate decarboxylase [Cytophagales bacterium]
MKTKDGTSGVQGISFQSLANQFGTPLYVYDAEKIAEQVRSMRTAFPDIRIKYAAKALTNISILHLMKKLGTGVDVVSIQEAQIALHAGFLAEEIMFTPNCVAFEEIIEGVTLGLNINLDNLPVLEKFGEKYGSSYPCILRLNPGILAGGNYKISTGHGHSKFGISVQAIDKIREAVGRYAIRIHGLHIHTGSEITDLDVFMKMADILFGLAPQFPHLQFLDFGGGLKVPYKEEDSETAVVELGQRLSAAFLKFREVHGRTLELWMEPGKYLVSEAGILLVTTNVVKETPHVTFAGVDSGLNHLIRPMMYDAYHHIVNVTNPEGIEKTYTVVGNICETDTFGLDRTLNEVREGDLLVIQNAGAYGYSMASNYNSRFRPAEVLIIDGEAKLIRHRDTMEQLLNGQVDIFQ